MRGVLWCNGSIPTESVVEWVLTTGAPVFGVDGGADKAHGLGIEVVEVLGDMDSSTNLLGRAGLCHSMSSLSVTW